MPTKSELAARLAAAEAQIAQLRAQDGPSLRQPHDAARVFRDLAKPEQECFMVAHLDARQKVLRCIVAHVGTLAHVDVHPRDIFREAVRYSVHSLLLCHNHPSGDPDPSPEDFELTRRLVEAGRLIGIPVIDHLVITLAGGTRSLAALGAI